MKNQKIFRHVVNGALLVSALALLSGCDMFKGKSCPTCEPSSVEAAKAEDILLTIEGKPAITAQKLQDFYEKAAANAGPYGGLSKKHAYDMLVMMEVLKSKMAKDKKDQDPKYRKEFEKARDMALYEVNQQMLVKEIMDTLDVSDAALESFYNENKGKNPAFDRPPFLKTPQGVKIQQVQFKDQKSAQDFLAKAQKSGADFVALAKAIKKEVKDLGMVSPQSQNVEFAVKLKARTLEPNAVDIATTSKGEYVVIRAVGQKQPAKYAEYAELIASMPQMKDMLAQFKKQTELEKEFMKRIEDYKKDLNLNDTSAAYFEKEESQKKAEEDKLKELLSSQAKGDADTKAEEKPAVAASTAQAA